MNNKQKAFKNFMAQIEINELKKGLLSKVMYERENVSDKVYKLAHITFEQLERDTNILDYLYYRYIESHYRIVN